MRNNRAKFKICLMSFLLATIFILPVFVFAADYKLLEPLPGPKGTEITTGEFSNYLKVLFNYAIAAAAVLAVVMIVIGGLQYIGAAGNTSVIEDAKDRIYWAIVGLFLSLGSVLILQTISPEFLKFELSSITKPTDITGSLDASKPFSCYIQFKTGASTEKPYDKKDECQKDCVIEKLEKQGYVEIHTAFCYGKGGASVTKITDLKDCGLLKKEETCNKTTICEWHTPTTYSGSGPQSWCQAKCGKFNNSQTECESEQNKEFCSWKAQIDYSGGAKYSCVNKKNQ